MEVPDWDEVEDGFGATAAPVPIPRAGRSQLDALKKPRRTSSSSSFGDLPPKTAKVVLGSSTGSSPCRVVATTLDWRVFDSPKHTRSSSSTTSIASVDMSDAPPPAVFKPPRPARRNRGRLAATSDGQDSDNNSDHEGSNGSSMKSPKRAARHSRQIVQDAMQGLSIDATTPTATTKSPPERAPAAPAPTTAATSNASATAAPFDYEPRVRGPRAASARLQGARFRMLNEKLYTTTGDDAFRWFKESPELFDVYHKGFATQVQRWPVNPVDRMIEFVLQKPAKLVVADMGCGEAKLGASVPNKVHSFDLVAANPSVTACDIAHVPLADEKIDICIFCLALMGTNYVDYLLEAFRILKPRGILKIAELQGDAKAHQNAWPSCEQVKSRIGESSAFVRMVQDVGFELTSEDARNTHFVDYEFVRMRTPGRRQLIRNSQQTQQVLQPCIYKRR
ncbi:uncharacterized protein MONBRDRAFT_29115 [Monosiga brevicollis MX1]|uniref:Ribosomal RNA-processing protein 8 n=1 Tax=Monosiga brevicollis TaxID=81824 RepID=A9VA61_MONBE|nr:uncharacterized protein MONBRDRAFT_29115 [Monosiga brevicollis MX1]EDQ85672.1 predicted protein [Monosiga brevicollis MX1]|eukprot:XP_001749621.1 hypothetical protein [Monosiga brevicollis MX1]